MTGHRVRWVALSVGAVVALLAVVLALQVGADERQSRPESELLGEVAPAFEVTTLDGASLTGDNLAGQAVIVNFWNSWCIPCQQEEPALVEFQARHGDEADFEMVGIVRDDSDRAARDHAEARGYEWTIALDPDAQAALAFGTRGQPETYAISPDGVVVGVQFGPSTVEDLEAMLAAARGGPA